MCKYTNIIVIAIFFILGLFSLGFSEESITITTYYPSPYGSYNQLYVADKLGIGTTSPQVKLDVQNSAGVSIIDTKGTGDAYNYAGLRIWSDAVTDKYWALWHKKDTANNFVIEEFNGAIYNQRFVITSGGNVGIGPTTPTATLEVKIGGSTLADAWTPRSSKRWKKNIQPIDSALDKIMKLRGVYFNWKETGKRDIGLIAEEVGTVIPEVVTYEQNGKDAKGLNYDRLVALLVEAVKAQQQEIQALKQKIDSLSKKGRSPLP